MKKTLILLLTGISSGLFATSFFSGETGAGSTFTNKKESGFEPAVYINGFFAGQLTISDMFSLRGEFSLRTPDMYDNGFTKEADNSIFQINELSATITKSFAGSTHTLSGFIGHFEDPGSQQYIIRHLGVNKFSSFVTENYLGQSGSETYPLCGIGGAYSLTLKSIPFSTGLVISRSDNFEDVKQMNADLHLATAFRYLTLDFLGGVGAPLYRVVDEGTPQERDVYLLIDTLYLHMGLDLLLGNRISPFSIFVQYGFEYFPVKSPDTAKSLVPSEVYLLVEPRFNLGNTKIHLTAYSMPEERIAKMELPDDTLGANLNIFCDTLTTGRRNYTLGFNGSVSFEDKYYNDLEDKDFLDSMNIKVAPYTNIEANGGQLRLMMQLGVTKLAKSKPNAIKLNIGYKKEL